MQLFYQAYILKLYSVGFCKLLKISIMISLAMFKNYDLKIFLKVIKKHKLHKYVKYMKNMLKKSKLCFRFLISHSCLITFENFLRNLTFQKELLFTMKCVVWAIFVLDLGVCIVNTIIFSNKYLVNLFRVIFFKGTSHLILFFLGTNTSSHTIWFV